MASYTHKNITVNFTEIDYADITGDTVLHLSAEMTAEMVTDCCGFQEYYCGYEIEELTTELEKDYDKIAEHIKEKGEEVEIRNSDAIISVYEHLLDQEEKYELEVHSENISWIIHDLLHAEHDTAGCTIHVQAEIEEQRILESLRITKDQHENLLPGFEFYEKLEEEYYNRFKKRIDLEEYKYPEYEEEY